MGQEPGAAKTSCYNSYLPGWTRGAALCHTERWPS